MRKYIILLLILMIALYISGCSKNNAVGINQGAKDLIESFQREMVTFYDFKNMQDNSLLITQIMEKLKKIEDNKKRLEQITGIAETVTDQKIKSELLNFIDLGREREKLVLKYINDLNKDLDYRYKNPDANVNINDYLANITNQLLDLEYRSAQSARRLNDMLIKK